jgi:hypothetical protein
MDDESLSLMFDLTIEDTDKLSSDSRDLQYAATLQRQELEHARAIQHQWQGGQGAQIFGSYFGTYNSAQNPLPVEESFAPRRSAPFPRAGPGNLDDDWLPDEIDMGLHSELGLPRIRAHGPNLDAKMYAELPNPPVNVPKQQCIACWEEIRICDLASVPCGHYYCSECLQSLFNAACGSESSFPAQCCQRQIYIAEKIAALLTKEIMDHYEEKRIEFQTNDRTYCHNCSTFINPVFFDRVGQAPCIECESLTCSRCKSKSHFGNCQPDAGAQQVIALAKEKGWKQCYNCEEMIELAYGCNHMDCTCGAQWCYICGKIWKTCSCIQLIQAEEGEPLEVPNVLMTQARQQPQLVLPQRAEFGDVRHEVRHCRHPHIVIVLPLQLGCVWCGNPLLHAWHCSQCNTEGCLNCLDSVRDPGMR